MLSNIGKETAYEKEDENHRSPESQMIQKWKSAGVSQLAHFFERSFLLDSESLDWRPDWSSRPMQTAQSS